MHRVPSLAAACALAALPVVAGAGDRPVTAPPSLAATVARAVAAQGGGEPGRAGLRLLDTGAEALRARDALIDAASASVDAQYYIWNSDASGRYLAARLLAAAERGVRVRILLDDVNVAGRDGTLAALAAHPNVAVRVYNPAPARKGLARMFAFLRDFGRLNRRMHNKSFTVDGLVTIVGGRNVGDEYFDLHPAVNFRDREILAVGPLVADARAAFEAFWESPVTLPAARLLGDGVPAPAPPDATELLREASAAVATAGYAPPAAAGRFVGEVLLAGLTWAPARLIYDPPPSPEAAADASVPQPVAVTLRGSIAGARDEILVESAYFILGDESLAEAARLAAGGVRLRAITNSLASNDLVTNHSGYARRRPAMLDAGIELHELRPDAAACARLVEYSPACRAGGPAFSLHSKSLVLDRRMVYVGSFNLNLRSAYLNSETALIIESPALAGRVADDIEALMRPDSSWQVRRDPRGRIEWVTVAGGQADVALREPRTGAWRRFQAGFYRLFPLEKYL